MSLQEEIPCQEKVQNHLEGIHPLPPGRELGGSRGEGVARSHSQVLIIRCAIDCPKGRASGLEELGASHKERLCCSVLSHSVVSDSLQPHRL